jgi:hypothetical protein
MYYPCGASGKFVMNFLSLSRYCTLHKFDLAVWDANVDVHDTNYYEKKLQHILNTVPDEVNCPDWQQYEMGNGILIDSDDTQFANNSAKILRRDQWFAVVAHTPDELDALIARIGTSTVIKITNYGKWLETTNFKLPRIKTKILDRVSYWNWIDKKELEIDLDKYWALIDIDSTIHDQEKWLVQIEQLYEQFGWDDFNRNLCAQYYNKYMSRHEF